MTIETIYNTLKSGNNIEKLMEDMKNYILINSTPNSSKKTQTAAAIKMFTKQKDRPILNNCVYVDDKQIMTNAIVMMVLAEDDYIAAINDITGTEDETRYPNARTFTQRSYSESREYINIDEIIGLCKVAEDTVEIRSRLYGKKMLLDAIKCLNVKKHENVYIGMDGYLTKIEKENGSYLIIVQQKMQGR